MNSVHQFEESLKTELIQNESTEEKLETKQDFTQYNDKNPSINT